MKIKSKNLKSNQSKRLLHRIYMDTKIVAEFPQENMNNRNSKMTTLMC